MKGISISQKALFAASLALIVAAGCGKKEEEAAAPKGEAQRTDVQAAPMGNSGTTQQPMSGVQKPAFDNTK